MKILPPADSDESGRNRHPDRRTKEKKKEKDQHQEHQDHED